MSRDALFQLGMGSILNTSQTEETDTAKVHAWMQVERPNVHVRLPRRPAAGLRFRGAAHKAGWGIAGALTSLAASPPSSAFQ